MMFDAWGPYPLKSAEWDDVDEFYKSVRDVPNLMDGGRGIYVVYTEATDGTVLPWYVGQTQRNFGARLFQHFQKRKFADLFQQGTVHVLLIARAKDGEAIAAKTEAQRQRDKKYIDWLEVDMIGACLKVNGNLLNKQHVSFFRDLHVPGYREQNGPDRDFPAAQIISRLCRS